MLYIDGKRREEASEYWQRKYEEVVDRLWKASTSKNRFNVTFRVSPKKIVTQYTTNGMEINTTGTEFVRLERTVDVPDEKGRIKKVNFAYSEEPLDEENGRVNIRKYSGLRRMFGDGKIYETIDDEELAFFLYFVHPRFGDDSRKVSYCLIDERSEAQKEVEDSRDEVEFKFLLYSENSPLRQDESKLRVVAKAWGVEDVNAETDIPLIIKRLKDKVMSGENAKKRGRTSARGIKEFMEDSNMGTMVEIMAIIQKAYEERLIDIETMKPNKMGVYWLNEEGNDHAGKILGLTGKTIDTWRTRLADHLMDNEQILNSIKSELGIATEREEKHASKKVDYIDLLDNFFEYDYKTQAKNVCKYFGLRTAGVKKEKWREQLIDVLKDKGEIPEDYQ
jgi:hypothetical protein